MLAFAEAFLDERAAAAAGARGGTAQGGTAHGGTAHGGTPLAHRRLARRGGASARRRGRAVRAGGRPRSWGRRRRCGPGRLGNPPRGHRHWRRGSGLRRDGRVRSGWGCACRRAARPARAADRYAGWLARGPRRRPGGPGYALAQRGAARPGRRGRGAAGGSRPWVRGRRVIAVAARYRVRRAAWLRQRTGRRASGRRCRSPPAGPG